SIDAWRACDANVVLDYIASFIQRRLRLDLGVA
ncbi:MAG: hypothetical protein ACI9MC_003669, partial [Kiritimatiellia bacterium]